MTDYTLHGAPSDIDALIYTGQTDENGVDILRTGLQVIGPRELDGVSYVNVRTGSTLAVPEDVSETGPQLSAALVGVWSDATS